MLLKSERRLREEIQLLRAQLQEQSSTFRGHEKQMVQLQVLGIQKLNITPFCCRPNWPNCKTCCAVSKLCLLCHPLMCLHLNIRALIEHNRREFYGIHLCHHVLRGGNRPPGLAQFYDYPAKIMRKNISIFLKN